MIGDRGGVIEIEVVGTLGGGVVWIVRSVGAFIEA